MASQVDICNQALARVGVRQFITALTDASLEAKVLSLLYGQVLDTVLQAFPWPFARRDDQVGSNIAVDLPPAYAYAYALSPYCLFARSLWPGTRAPRAALRIPFMVSVFGGSKVLFCDLPPTPRPILSYTARIGDAGLFPPLFVDAFSALLASRLAMPLAVSAELKNAALQDYALAIGEARATAFREGQEDLPPDSELISCRI